MKLLRTTSALAMLAGMLSVAGAACAADAAAPEHVTLEEVIVTAQKRATNLETTPEAITAVSGQTLEKDKILTFADLARSVVGLSYTQNNPLRQEYNIRGAVNTRLGSATADQSVGIFVDDVYVSRSGTLNPPFYDDSQVEIIRGPQGVLLGRNVAAGAISVTSAPPSSTPSGELAIGYGNYDDITSHGYFTGPIAPGLTGRFSFITENHSGYNEDIYHNVGLDNLNQVAGRAQLMWQPEGSDFQAHLLVDYNKQSTNGMCAVALSGISQGDPLWTGPDPWSTVRADIGAQLGHPLTDRQCLPTWPTFKGNASPTPQGGNEENWSTILKLEKGLPYHVKVTSITGFRDGHSYVMYDQSGVGPENPFGLFLNEDPGNVLAFAFPVQFNEVATQFSEEVRFTSDYDHSRFDWIAGAYYERDKVHQNNEFWAENEAGIDVLQGEDNWNDHGGTETYAVFAQGGYNILQQLKLEAGVRYTHDTKSGFVTATAVQIGSQYDDYTDPVPLTTLSNCGQQIYVNGVCTTPSPNYSTPYSASWDAVTPQAILRYTPTDNIMTYVSVGKGFKGGGFENNTGPVSGATTPYNPETDVNYEFGFKTQFLQKTAQFNFAYYYTFYNNLQVEQTSDVCLCNIVGNAGNAQFKGVEGEFEYRPIRQLFFWASGDIANAKYVHFIDPAGNNYSGNEAQRTPNYQYVLGGEATLDLPGMPDALLFHINWKQQGKMYWLPDNLTHENPYGLLDGRVTFFLPARNWSVSLWGKNLTNTLYRTNIIAFFGDEVSTFGAPRTYGVELAAKF